MAIDGIYGIQVHQGRWNSKIVNKFGFNTDIGTDIETVWDQGGAYSYLSSASVLKISSSNANDTSDGTGARTVQVYGVDTNFNEIDEIITLNGQTPVNTSKSYLRIYRMIIRTAGTGEENAGDIYAGTGTVSSGVPSNKYAKIVATHNQTLMALWTVPSGFTGYLYQFDCSSGSTLANKFQTIKLFIRPHNEVFQVKDVQTIHNSNIVLDYGIPLKINEKSDIEVRAFSSSGTDAVSANFSVIYKKNT
jgi:hypothetical protein